MTDESPPETLRSIEHHFHELIRQRGISFVESASISNLQLPKIDYTTPSSYKDKSWFPVPGMYGGFTYWLKFTADRPKLMCSSWSRIIEGFEETHEIHAEGSKLVENRWLGPLVFEP